MNKKPLPISNEISLGCAVMAAGALAIATGHHGIIAQGLLPFGGGLILFDLLTRLGKSTREGIKVLIRRDDD